MLLIQIQAAPNTQLQMQGLKYSVDETSPLDTIQVSNIFKKRSFIVPIG